MSKVTIKTPSSLSFERRLSPSDALMSAGVWGGEEWTPIKVIEKSVRGVISNRIKNAKSSDPAKLGHNIEAANLQTIDAAALGADSDTLRVTFSLRVLAGVQSPVTCSDIDYKHHIEQVIGDYIEREGMRELARRYAYNIASARFLWRNRAGCQHFSVIVRHEGEVFTFDDQLPLGEFTDAPGVDRLAEIIAGALSGATASILLNVEAYARLGEGQEVYPSQELVLDKNNKKGRILYALDGQAAMHSQKIGNAIRTIDTWHGMVEQLGAISVEPYGSVTALGVATRAPGSKLDFYTLLDSWMVKGIAPELNQQHYVVAQLVRGGVFGEKSE